MSMFLPSSRTTLTGLLLIAQFTVQISAQKCWRPDGTEATNQTACPGVTDTSSGPCCQNAEWPNVDPCLSNGYCLSTTAGYLYQGGCTSKSWLGCKNECTAGFYGADYAVITPCYTPQDQSLACCGFIGDSRTQSCCSNAEGFNFSTDGTPTFLGPLNATTLSNVTATSEDTSKELSAAGSTVTVTAAATNTSSSDMVSMGTAIGVGVGLGIPLAIALGSVAWLWILLRRQSSKHQRSDMLPQGQVAPVGWHSDGLSPQSPPAELKAKHDISEVSSDRYPVEAPTERM